MFIDRVTQFPSIAQSPKEPREIRLLYKQSDLRIQNFQPVTTSGDGWITIINTHWSAVKIWISNNGKLIESTPLVALPMQNVPNSSTATWARCIWFCQKQEDQPHCMENERAQLRCVHLSSGKKAAPSSMQLTNQWHHYHSFLQFSATDILNGLRWFSFARWKVQPAASRVQL